MTDEEMAFRLADRPACCVNCKKTAYVDYMSRVSGRWTCYSCGRVNRWETTQLVCSDAQMASKRSDG